MANEREVEVKLTADVSKFNAEMDKAAQRFLTDTQRMQSAMREMSLSVSGSAREMQQNIKNHFDGLGSTFGKLNGAMLAVGTVLAGGTVFKAAINETVNMTKEAILLSRALGISATEASILNVALGDIYQSSETLINANQKMTRQLKDNESAFTNLGVKTRDQNGEFRSSLDIMQDVNKRLLQFKEGVDRNIEGQKIYGKAWQEVSGIIRLTSDVMEASRVKAEKLNLIIGSENLEATTRYRAAMNDVSDVLKAVQKAIGEGLMPVLTKLGEWFSDMGPGVVVIFKGAIGGLAAVFHGLTLAVSILWELVKLAFNNMIEIGVAWAKVMKAALTGDFSGAVAAAKEGMANLKNSAHQAFETIISDAQKTREQLANLFMNPTTTQQKGSGGERSLGGEDKDKSRFSEWEAVLAAQRDAYDKQRIEQGSFQEFTKAMERDYWKAILDTQKLTFDERVKVSQKYYSLEKELRKDAFQTEIAELKMQMEAYRTGSVERIRIAGEMAAKIGEKYGLESKEYKAALGEMTKLALDRQKEQERLDSLAIDRNRQYHTSLIDLERERLRLSREMGDINAVQELEALKKLKQKEFEIEFKAAQDKLTLIHEDTVAREQAMNRINELKDKHAIEMQKIDTQIFVETRNRWEELLSSISSAFETSVKGMILGTTTFQKAISNMGNAILGEFISLSVKMLMKWVATELAKTSATVTGVATRGTAEKAGASQSILTTAGTAIKNIGASAWEAAASVYKSIAAIPVVGPFMAPAMAVAAGATVLGFIGRIASAAGGYDVPQDMIANIHKDEMVLPANLSNKIRGMTEGSSSPNINVSYTVHALDAKGVRDMLKEHGNTIADVLRAQHRDFKPI